jgi:hypothetical protein
LLAFRKSEDINEVYVSISERSKDAKERQLVQLIKLLHHSKIRVEALLSRTKRTSRENTENTLFRHVEEILEFNHRHPSEHFDGIHLDIEPQQRPENKGRGNLRFLPGLADADRAVCSVAEPAGLTVNADIQNKLLKGDLAQRKMLLAAVPRVTLMMQDLSSPTDGEDTEQKAQLSSQKFFDMAFDGFGEQNLANMAIALRTPDYLDVLPELLRKLDDTNRSNPHYLGWARHSYNDHLNATQ